MARTPRREERVKRRTPCELVVAGRLFRAIALDLSPSGMFIQTQHSVAPGTEVVVRLRAPERDEPIELEAVVARVRRVPTQLATVASGGVGLNLRNAPAAYRDLLARIAPDGMDLTPRSRPVASAPDASAAPQGGDAASQGGSAGARAAPQGAQPRPIGQGAVRRTSSRVGASGAVRPPAARSPEGTDGPRASGETSAGRPSQRAAAPRFRVRVKLRGGSRSRTLVVDGATPAAARTAALARTGDDWEVLAVERA